MPDPTHQPENPGTPDNPGGPIRQLSDLDAQALDALLETRAAGADPASGGPIPAGLRDRTDKVTELLSLLNQDPTQDPPADLTTRTIQAIRAHEQRQRFSQQVQMLAEPRRTIGIAWQQFATAAAVLIIGTSLLMPMMDRQQADSRKVVGAGNLQMAGRAMAQYATANLGQMPRGNVKPGMPWWEVGQSASTQNAEEHSNSAHLYRLVNKGYIKADKLVCPENAYARSGHTSDDQHDWDNPRAVSFSYQNQYSLRVPRLVEAPGMAILADRNPIFYVNQADRIAFDASTPLNASSRAHRGTGQNVLTANGVVSWRIRPTVDPFGQKQMDNIWKANGINVYTGNETTDDPFDSFLVP
jgi:hypothetical protein